MKFQINHFLFDCEQLILSRNGNVINLSEKPAQLLSLFLLQPDKIHNKEGILDHVWDGRAISEQVVFQNISLLRTIFGNDAIKTFVKKGYQWQLEFSEFVEDNTPTKKVVSPVTELRVGSSKPKAITRLIIFFSLIFLLAWSISQFDTYTIKEDSQAILHVVSTKKSDSIQYEFAFVNDQVITQRAPKSFTPQYLFDSPFKSWEKLAVKKDDLVLGVRFYGVLDGYVLRFSIQGQYRGFQGHIMEKNQNVCIEKLDQLIELLSFSEYFTVKAEHLALIELTQLHEKHPNNPLLTLKLANINYELGYLDRAAALADNILENTLNSLDKGLFHLLKSKVGLRSTHLEQAQTSIAQSLKLFSQLGLPHLVALSRIEQAWYNVHINDHTAAMKSVNFSVGATRTAKEPLLEVMSHLVQAILAAKYKQNTLMKNELDLTQQLFDLHNLGDEHQTPVLYLLATTAETETKKNQYFEDILAQPFSQQYTHNFYLAAINLRQYYVLNHEWQLAENTIKMWQRRSFTALSQAHILFAQNDITKGINATVKAFRYSQIDYILQDSLDAALLLLQHKKDSTHSAFSTDFLEFIKQNANLRWIEINKSALVALSVFNEIARHY